MPSVECKKCSSINVVPKSATSFTCNICGSEQEIAPETDNSGQYLDNTFIGGTHSRSSFNTVREYNNSDNETFSAEPESIAGDDVPPEDVIYYSAVARMNRDSINNYIKALEGLQTIPDWKDSKKLMAICRQYIDDYFQQQDLEKAEKKRRIKKRLAVIIPSVLGAALVVMAVLWFIFSYLPDIKYQKAVALENSGDYISAYETYIDLNGFKDSVSRAEHIYIEYKAQKLEKADVGDIIYFGAYEQDNNTANGKEDLSWKVLEKNGSKLFVITEYGVDCIQFNKTETAITWELSSVRKFLNTTFLNSAFDPSQRSQILKTTVTAEKNGNYDTNPGEDTTDKVFLLSISEAEELMSEEDRQCVPTPFSVAKDCNVKKKKYSSEQTTCWFLRSPGIENTKVAYAQYEGDIRAIGANVSSSQATIRPAMWITIK